MTAVLQDRLKARELDKLAFTPAQQQEILTLSAILQIAEGLDQSEDHSTIIEQIELSEDGLWIVVSGPQAELDGDSAEKRSALWMKLGYPEISVLLPEQAALRAAPFPKPLDVIGIHPHDLLSEAGRKVMRYHFAEMLRHEAGTRLGEDIEALHDMRVATRRLRAAFEVFGSAFDKKALKPHLDGLRDSRAHARRGAGYGRLHGKGAEISGDASRRPAIRAQPAARALEGAARPGSP